uniref:Uncharacterized protein n=1 Tax=Cannabis sativa TaxID=3483 RepID=A0A803QUF6_CANSA
MEFWSLGFTPYPISVFEAARRASRSCLFRPDKAKGFPFLLINCMSRFFSEVICFSLPNIFNF